MRQKPGEDYREQRRPHMEVDFPTRPVGRAVEHRGYPDQAGYRERVDDDQCEPVVRLSAARYPGRLLGRGPYHHHAEQRQINDHGNIVGDQQVELVGQGDRRQIGNRSGDDCSGDSSRPPDEPRQMAAKGWGDQFVHVSASFSAGCPTCRGAMHYNSLLRLAGCVTALRSWPTPCCCSSRYRLPCATGSMRDLYGFLSPALSPSPSSPTGSAGPPSSLRNAPAAPSAVCSMSASATSPSSCSPSLSSGRRKSAWSKRRSPARSSARHCCFSASPPWSAGSDALGRPSARRAPVYCRRCCFWWSSPFYCPRYSTSPNAPRHPGRTSP